MLVTEPIETIHLYYEQDDIPQPRANHDTFLILLACLCFGLLVWQLCSIPPTLETIRVPAHLLPLRRFSVPITIVPTGVHTSPATTATGVLTVYNGSFLSQQLPQGLILVAQNGVEVATESSVVVPAANPPAYGMATVVAHALVSGSRGNLAAGQIANVEGASLYIRNLPPFQGGQDASRQVYVTAQDRQHALEVARATLHHLVPQGMLDGPCRESSRGNQLMWICRYVTYASPQFFRIVGVEVQGRQVVVYGYALACPQRTTPR